PNAVREFAVQFTPRAAGACQVRTWLAIARGSAVQVQVLQPNLALSLYQNGGFHLGRSTALMLKIANAGPGVAHDMELETLLPKMLRFQKGHAPTVKLGSLASGESKEIEIPVRVVGKGEASVKVALRAAGGIEASSSGKVKVLGPRLRVSTHSPSVQNVNDVGLFAAELSNDGDSPLESVTVLAAVSQGDASIVDAEKGARIGPDKRVLGWTMKRLSPGETRIFRWWVVGKKPGTAKQKVIIESKHQVKQQRVMTTQVRSAPKLVLEVSDLTDPVEVGEEVVFRARLMNVGHSPAENIIVEAVLDEGLQPVRSSNEPGRKWDGNRVILGPLKSLGAGQAEVFQIRAVAGQDGPRNIRVRARVNNRVLMERVETTHVQPRRRTLLR
ncbi:MAG: DUF11 domain-containing protein, partial [Planctomycetales bacterium]